jgi:hypothetical protein
VYGTAVQHVHAVELAEMLLYVAAHLRCGVGVRYCSRECTWIQDAEDALVVERGTAEACSSQCTTVLNAMFGGETA